jgi:hypothetical protein
MMASERAVLSQMDDYTLDGKFHEATEAFCRLAAGGHDVRRLVTHIMATAAPYLHVPAHEKLLPNGEFRNARSIIEEYTHNTSSERRKNVLFEAWTHFLSFYRKRTLSPDCYELYQRYFMS